MPGYYPECNALIPWWHHAKDSDTPAAKLVRVRIRQSAAGQDANRSGWTEGPSVVPQVEAGLEGAAVSPGQKARP